MRNDEQELIGINKNKSSSINMTLDGSTIETITFFKEVEGEIYPEKELPENARKLRGFVWRGEERIKSKEDIFPSEENQYDIKAAVDAKAELIEDELPMKPRKETLQYDKKNKK